MTKPMTDERLNQIEQNTRMSEGVSSQTAFELCGEIRRLRAESEDRKSRLDTLFKHHEAEVERLKEEAQIVDTELQFKNLVIKARNEKLTAHEEAIAWAADCLKGHGNKLAVKEMYRRARLEEK
jgi:hypothetical protein